MTGDPVHKSADIGVDTRLVLLAAAVAPAHHTNNIVGPITVTHQRSTGVTLHREEVLSGSLFFILMNTVVKQITSLTDLAGVNTSLHVAGTEHAVIQ